MDRLHTMAVFVAVAEQSGFAPAARKLNLSPPSVTRAVSELEQRLGARLFHRTTRSVQLTSAGERYLVDCQRILSEMAEADRQAAGIHAAPSGSVSLTASVMFGRIMITPILVDLLEQYPDIAVNAQFVDRVVSMMDEGVDVAVRIAELADSSLAAVRVGTVRRILCGSPSYFDRAGLPATPADLASHKIVDFASMTAAGEWRFEKEGKSIAVRPNSRLRVNSADAAISAVSAGHGITRVLSYMIQEKVESGELVIVLDDVEPAPVPVHVVHKEAGNATGRVRAVVDFLVDALRKSPALRGPTGLGSAP